MNHQAPTFFVLLFLAVCALCTGQEPVPSDQFREMRDEMVPVDADLPTAEKTRRLEAVMREGRALLREYPEAENLYVVRHVMLEAARRLLRLGQRVPRDEVLNLARRIMEADPPPEWRYSADALFTQMKVYEAAAAKDVVRQLLEEFVARYTDIGHRNLAAQALMQAADLAVELDLDKARWSYLHTLRDRYPWQPGVAEFLLGHGQHVLGLHKVLAGDLPLLDGGTLHMPQDTIGKTVVAVFWTVKSPKCLELMERLQDFYEQYKDRRFLCVGINLDEKEDEEQVRRAIRERGITWAQAFTGEGMNNLMARRYTVRQIPSPWIVDSASRARKITRGDTRWVHLKPRIEKVLETDVRRYLRQLNLRSGVFLADLILREERAKGEDALPAGALDGLLDRLFQFRLSPHPEERLGLAADLLTAVREVEERHPGAANLDVLRAVEMALLQYRFVGGAEDARREPALALARELIESDAVSPEVHMLCDYLTSRAKLVRDPKSLIHGGAVIERLKETREPKAADWVVRFLTTMITNEFGPGRIGGWFHINVRTARDVHPRAAGLYRGLWASGLKCYSSFEADLETFDGEPLGLPEDLLGSLYTVCFWTMDCPPGAEWYETIPPDRPYTHVNKLTPHPERGYRIVGVNLDVDKEAARRYAEEHFPDWVHTYIGPDRAHPLLRRLDVQALPSAWFVLDNGEIQAHDNTHGLYGSHSPIAMSKISQVGDMPIGTLEEWEETFGTWREALSRLGIHIALGLYENKSEELIQEKAVDGAAAARKILPRGLELNRPLVEEHRAALRELLPELDRDDEGNWQPKAKLKEAWEHIRQFRRAAGNLEDMSLAARMTAFWADEDFPVEEYTGIAPEPLDLPEVFPQPPAKKK